MAVMTVVPLQRDVEYPESDGKPMAESDVHRKEMVDLITALDDHFDPVPDVYVAGNLFVYYEKGNRRAVVAPDVFVVKGVPKGNRRVYKLWEEGAAPCFVIEVTSNSTQDEDQRDKKDRYSRLGVEEYFLHDPLGDYLEPPLQGFRLVAGRYLPMETEPDGSFRSRTTGLTLRREGQSLRLIDPITGEPLLRVKEAQALARSERAARQAAEAELARLRRELERQRGG
jgi:Uma2 family endonuclease